MRRRLVRYFDYRNCLSPDDLADETLNRVARKLQEKGEIVGATPAHYCYIVARLVFLESVRRKEHNAPSLDDTERSASVMASLAASSEPTTDTPVKEKLFTCLERCLRRLRMQDRELILDYYRGEQGEKIERRSQMARHLALTMNALSIRACRIRNKLEACVKACSEET
ncbi:MAG TPA: hypothetical protein VNB49_16935 [Candidatus Dormibacteraeota bacterium]|nr:hypothetical protein [Candidatus Dormibacteraeota bacterium]